MKTKQDSFQKVTEKMQTKEEEEEEEVEEEEEKENGINAALALVQV